MPVLDSKFRIALTLHDELLRRANRFSTDQLVRRIDDMEGNIRCHGDYSLAGKLIQSVQ